MSMRLMVIGCLTTCRDQPLTMLAFVFQKPLIHDKILEAVHTAFETLRTMT